MESEDVMGNRKGKSAVTAKVNPVEEAKLTGKGVRETCRGFCDPTWKSIVAVLAGYVVINRTLDENAQRYFKTAIVRDASQSSNSSHRGM
ncbi:hypothetical protein HPP92_009162 [Vanilla planifolia]|uniref:Uncharacterized protein n=1 Tax=Vanilla planifolia TaxID=51239 RepID=A0A835R7D4_VANPL|nr:hypothetical protein HPP92_009162 [Vanilla planifolia]